MLMIPGTPAQFSDPAVSRLNVPAVTDSAPFRVRLALSSNVAAALLSVTVFAVAAAVIVVV
jgi:hypothetical protein